MWNCGLSLTCISRVSFIASLSMIRFLNSSGSEMRSHAGADSDEVAMVLGCSVILTGLMLKLGKCLRKPAQAGWPEIKYIDPQRELTSCLGTMGGFIQAAGGITPNRTSRGGIRVAGAFPDD